jgi:hypothetical protein
MNKENEENEEQEGFRVTDKRSFQEDGAQRTPDVPKEEDEKTRARTSSEEESETSEEKKTPLPPIDFPSYILSYYTQGLVLLGEVPNPYSGKKEEDVDAAKHIIDILTLLKEKTKGNLSQDEEKLLESVLYELRMKFMAKSNLIKL